MSETENPAIPSIVETVLDGPFRATEVNADSAHISTINGKSVVAESLRVRAIIAELPKNGDYSNGIEDMDVFETIKQLGLQIEAIIRTLRQLHPDAYDQIDIP